MFTLDSVVPWGRSFDEYCRMFELTEGDLDGRILGCGDGPASFNAEATRRGHRVLSCDPIYRFGRSQIQDRITATYDEVLAQTRLNAHEFVWGEGIRNVEELGHVRMAAMGTFVEDFESGRRAGRYVNAELPNLPFEDGAFELALCSHFLFLYSEQLGEAFHRAGLHEMCRVAAEVRVFPLLALGSHRSQFVDGCVEDLTTAGYHVSIERVPYEFQRGGNEMMRVVHGRNRTRRDRRHPVATKRVPDKGSHSAQRVDTDRPLAGAVAVVAGATRGAGRGIARALGEAGAVVYCTGRSVKGRPSPYKRPETIDETAAMINDAGGTAMAVRLDHTVEADVKALFRRIDRKHRRTWVEMRCLRTHSPAVGPPAGDADRREFRSGQSIVRRR